MNVNGNSYQEQGRAPRAHQAYFNGGAKNGAGSMREKISFDPPRVPVILRPENVPAHPVMGKFGEQYRWEFEGNQVAWFDPDVHKEICACLEVSGCNEIAITKHVRRGQQPRFEVQGVDDQTGQPARPAPAQTAARRIAEIQNGQPGGYDPAPPAPRKPLPRVGPSRVWQNESASEAETAPPANAMAAALVEAIIACQEVIGIATANGIAWKPSSEDIRALAITIYIQKEKR